MITSASLRTVTNKSRGSASNGGPFLLSWKNHTSCYGKATQILMNKQSNQMGGLCTRGWLQRACCNTKCSACQWGHGRRSSQLAEAAAHKKGCSQPPALSSPPCCQTSLDWSWCYASCCPALEAEQSALHSSAPHSLRKFLWVGVVTTVWFNSRQLDACLG